MDRLNIGSRVVELARIAVAVHLELERDEAERSRQRDPWILLMIQMTRWIPPTATCRRQRP